MSLFIISVRVGPELKFEKPPYRGCQTDHEPAQQDNPIHSSKDRLHELISKTNECEADEKHRQANYRPKYN